MSIFGQIDDATDTVLSFLLRPVRSVIRAGAKVVAGWAKNIFGLVSDGWDEVTAGASALSHGFATFPGAVYHGLYHLVRIVVPGVLDWAGGEIYRLGHLIVHYADIAANAVARLEHKAWTDLQRGIRWLYLDIIAPVADRVSFAEHYLFRDVRAVVELVTHPARLVEHLWDAGLSAVAELTHDLLPPTLRWLKHSAARDVVDAAHGVEAVIAAML